MDSSLLIGIAFLLLCMYGFFLCLRFFYRLVFGPKQKVNPIQPTKAPIEYTDHLHLRKTPEEREKAMMEELDEITTKVDTKEWLQVYKDAYDYGEIPPRVYARAMCKIEGKKWYTEEEYKALHPDE